MQTGGVLTAMRANPDGFMHLFVGEKTTTMSSSDMCELFAPTYSQDGSNHRMVENRITGFWRDWMIDIQGELWTNIFIDVVC